MIWYVDEMQLKVDWYAVNTPKCWNINILVFLTAPKALSLICAWTYRIKLPDGTSSSTRIIVNMIKNENRHGIMITMSITILQIVNEMAKKIK